MENDVRIVSSILKTWDSTYPNRYPHLKLQKIIFSVPKCIKFIIESRSDVSDAMNSKDNSKIYLDRRYANFVVQQMR